MCQVHIGAYVSLLMPGETDDMISIEYRVPSELVDPGPVVTLEFYKRKNNRAGSGVRVPRGSDF